MTVSLDTPSYAIIEGALCRVNRRGTIVKRHRPMGSSVAEFAASGSTLIVREQAEGFLAGMPNLYCVDENLRLLWLAELPTPDDAYVGCPVIEQAAVCCHSLRGLSCRLDLATGRLLR